MKKLLLGGLLALAAVALVVTVATANNGNGHRGNGLQAKLDGYQEVPTLSVPGAQGQFRAKVRNGSVEFTLRYSGLTSAATVAHIHLGRPATTGDPIVFLCGGSKPACPASGEVTGTLVAADVIGPAAQGIDPGEFDEFVAALRAKATYVNVHTTEHTAGEIRGDIGGKFHGFGFGREGGKGHDRDDD
jgi:hypothetical protein